MKINKFEELNVVYITETEFNRINLILESLANQIGVFITYLETKRNKKEFLKTR